VRGHQGLRRHGQEGVVDDISTVTVGFILSALEGISPQVLDQSGGASSRALTDAPPDPQDLIGLNATQRPLCQLLKAT